MCSNITITILLYVFGFVNFDCDICVGFDTRHEFVNSDHLSFYLLIFVSLMDVLNMYFWYFMINEMSYSYEIQLNRDIIDMITIDTGNDDTAKERDFQNVIESLAYGIILPNINVNKSNNSKFIKILCHSPLVWKYIRIETISKILVNINDKYKNPCIFETIPKNGLIGLTLTKWDYLDKTHSNSIESIYYIYKLYSISNETSITYPVLATKEATHSLDSFLNHFEKKYDISKSNNTNNNTISISNACVIALFGTFDLVNDYSVALNDNICNIVDKTMARSVKMNSNDSGGGNDTDNKEDRNSIQSLDKIQTYSHILSHTCFERSIGLIDGTMFHYACHYLNFNVIEHILSNSNYNQYIIENLLFKKDKKNCNIFHYIALRNLYNLKMSENNRQAKARDTVEILKLVINTVINNSDSDDGDNSKLNEMFGDKQDWSFLSQMENSTPFDWAICLSTWEVVECMIDQGRCLDRMTKDEIELYIDRIEKMRFGEIDACSKFYGIIMSNTIFNQKYIPERERICINLDKVLKARLESGTDSK